METAILKGLRHIREDLLRQYILSSNSEKAELLSKIMDLEEQIEKEEEALHRTLA